jgi:hypothetical protein
MYFQLLSVAPAVELHPWHRDHVLSQQELLVVVAVVGRAHKMVIPDNRFIRQLVVDVLQFAYRTQQRI